MKKVLLTGFGPYGHTAVNPAQLVADALDGDVVEGGEIVSTIVPCVFFKSIAAVKQAIEQHKPDAVVMMGDYGGRSMLTVERIAHNLNDATRYGLTDNDGNALQDQPTAEDGPVAYYSTLPIRAMVKAMRIGGIPADISDTPGTLVCNHLMYGVLHEIAKAGLPIRAGWIHLPHLPLTAALVENLGAPSMSEQTAAAGVKIAIQAIVNHDVDIDEPIISRLQI